MAKILITGALGFIGHNVTNFLEKEHHVIGIDNKTTYGFVPQDELNYLINSRRRRITSNVDTIDIRDHNQLEPYFNNKDIDTVVHLASFPRQKVVEGNPALASEVMATGLINLLELSKKYGVKRFVYISSSMVYGDFLTVVTEDSPCNPIGQYGIMKYMGEKLVEDYARRTGMEYVIIRPSAVYGEWDVEDRVVSKFMLTAMKGGTLKVNGPDEVLDFTYVEDAAKGIAQAAVSTDAKNQIFNITRSSPDLYTLADAAELAVKIAGKGDIIMAPRDMSFPKRGRLSIAKARGYFGYEPKVDVEEGFRRYYEWFSNSDYWQNKING